MSTSVRVENESSDHETREWQQHHTGLGLPVVTAHRSRSRDQERRIAKDVDGSATPASGAFWSRKGDVRSRDMLLEAKYTDKASFRITKEIWEKIRKEALLDGKTPVLVLGIQDRGLAVLDWDDFLALTAIVAEHLGERELP